MKPRHDLNGMVFGNWTVVRKDDYQGKNRKWLCRCSCGVERAVFQFHLLKGLSKSCDASGGHGFNATSHPNYGSWLNMKDRCLRKNNPFFSRYGGRGIEICERWKSSFRAFCEDMGTRPDGMTLDRIDNDGNYEPSNCRWATQQEQANNTSANRYLLDNGEVLTIAQFARKNGVPYGTLHSRILRKSNKYSYVTV